MDIKPLVTLRPMHGFMHGFFSRLSQSLLGLIVTIAVCAGLGFLSASQARIEYRNYLGFSGQLPTNSVSEELMDDQKSSTIEESDSLFALDLENKYLDSALNFAGDAKDWTADQLINNPIADGYNKLNEDYQLMRFKLLKLVEFIIFWISFVITFFTTMFAIGKLKHLKDSLTEKTDPAIEDNIQRLAKAVNSLNEKIEQQTHLAQAPLSVQNSPQSNPPNPSQNG